jgi:hypothetical protein
MAIGCIMECRFALQGTIFNSLSIFVKDGELPDDVDWTFVFRIDPDGTVSRVMSTTRKGRFSSTAQRAELANSKEALLSENIIKVTIFY